jgi:hypothetical protein
MIDQAAAATIASEYLAGRSGANRLVLQPEHTIERAFGWVFFYDSKEFVDSADIRYALVGNAPLIVDRADGSIHVTGTAEPIQFYIKKYEELKHLADTRE